MDKSQPINHKKYFKAFMDKNFKITNNYKDTIKLTTIWNMMNITDEYKKIWKATPYEARGKDIGRKAVYTFLENNYNVKLTTQGSFIRGIKPIDNVREIVSDVLDDIIKIIETADNI